MTLEARRGAAPLVFFPVSVAGVLVPGLLPGAFTCTLVEPLGTAVDVLAVTESLSLPGLYYATTNAGFFTTYGTGDYSMLVTVAAPASVILEHVRIVDPDGEPKLGLTWDAAASVVRAHVWLERGIGQVLTGLSNATFRLYDRTGVALTALATTAAADAQGVFAFNVATPSLPVGETATYAVITVDDAGLPARTWRTVVACTFSRTS